MPAKRVTKLGIAKIGTHRSSEIPLLEIDFKENFEWDESDKIPLFTTLTLDEIMGMLEPLL